MIRFNEKIVVGVKPGTTARIQNVLDEDVETLSQFIRGAINIALEKREEQKRTKSTSQLSPLRVKKVSPTTSTFLKSTKLDTEIIEVDEDQDDGPPEESSSDEIAAALHTHLQLAPAKKSSHVDDIVSSNSFDIDPNRKMMPCCRIDGTPVYEDEPDAYKYKMLE